ncbi:hypothetical protein [Crenalkalicoccus roseus]|uniref:hypothetical protein n=1 Tax=Crenalkalicoccus roseus TaxID=1485588 RepID=UPI001080DC22|nr:hypothetical protein [Crenalkalicoccus roseus]
MDNVSERSFEQLGEADLERIRDLAVDVLAAAFARAPVASLYRDRLLLLALCQGAAKHWIDGKHGLKDIDVWAFFRAGPQQPFPYRTIWNADFGPSRFGRHPRDDAYTGRRIDVLGRSIACRDDERPDQALRSWLAAGSKSAMELAKRPVIGLAPAAYFGKVIWQPATMPASSA